MQEAPVRTAGSGDGTQINTRETDWFQTELLREESDDSKIKSQMFNTEGQPAQLQRMMGYTASLGSSCNSFIQCIMG